MRRLLAGVAVAVLAGFSGACKKGAPGDLTGFGVAFVDAARGQGLAAEWIDDALITRIRRAERMQGAARSASPIEAVARAFRGENAPSVETRSAKLRARVSMGIERSLHGRCEARDDPEALGKRRDAMTAPIASAAPDANEELASLKRALAEAHLLRVSCDDGAIGLVVVPSGKSWQAVDVFPLGGLQMPIPVPAAPGGPAPTAPAPAAPAPAAPAAH